MYIDRHKYSRPFGGDIIRNGNNAAFLKYGVNILSRKSKEGKADR